MSFLSCAFFGILVGLIIGLVICVQIAGVYVVWQFLRDQFRRHRKDP